jgi:hypothetical protein
MTPPQATPGLDARQGPFRWSVIDTARAYADFSGPLSPPLSQREFARDNAIPRSTLGSWLRKDFPDHLDPAFVSFFRSPAGVAFLRRLVLSLLLVFHHRSPCGLRPIGSFLELVHLHYFVASSYGALYDLDQSLQTDLDLFAQQERQRLAPHMSPKDVCLCLDENFHGPQICLVAVEPVSNFILVETYRDQRDSVTWTKVITASIEGLPIHVVALTSDQASALVCCAEQDLQVLHYPDLMHLQQALAKPLLLPLARPIHQAKKDLEKLKQEEQRLDQAEKKKPGSLTIERCVAHIRAEEQAKKDLEESQQRLDRAVEQIRGISAAYHPFDRETGQRVTAEQMQTRLTEPLDRLQEVVEEAGLSERADEGVQKARKWVVLLVGCIAWFWTRTRQRLEKLDLSEEAQGEIEEHLLAGHYWEVASGKEKDPEQRKRLAEMGEQLRKRAWSEGGALAGLSEDKKKEVERVTRQ